MAKEEHLRQKIKNYVLSLFEGIEETPTKEEKEWLENCLYLFAEPREKRIVELEEKNKSLTEQVCNVANNLLDNWCRNEEDYCPHLAKLEKENAELKADNDARKFAMAMSEKVEKQLREENAKLKARLNAINILTPELQRLSKEKKAQLTKAKELLNEFMRISKASDEDFEHDYSNLIAEAENFLNSEVEK